MEWTLRGGSVRYSTWARTRDRSIRARGLLLRRVGSPSIRHVSMKAHRGTPESPQVAKYSGKTASRDHGCSPNVALSRKELLSAELAADESNLVRHFGLPRTDPERQTRRDPIAKEYSKDKNEHRAVAGPDADGGRKGRLYDN